VDSWATVIPYLGTAAGLFVTSVVALWRGWLIQGPLHRAILAILQARLDDRDRTIDELKRTISAHEKRGDLLAEQIFKLVEANRTTTAVIKALPTPAPLERDVA
jgi:hypothetical protein